ncbi:MAG: polyhydroxyalkanoate synthesis repressor PhaR [Pseudomonadota bacterium]
MVDGDDTLPILIKKYPNRRLYNTSTSAYIVLDDIIELVKSGDEFVIEDTKTGQDITRSILNQIIFEQETKPSDFHFPLEFQKQLISMYGDNYGKMVPDYLTESLRLFASERKELADAVGSVLNRNTKAVLDYSRALAQQNMELFKRSVSMFTGPLTGLEGEPKSDRQNAKSDTKADGETAKASKSADGRDTALDDIQKQIDALQERLKQLK